MRTFSIANTSLISSTNKSIACDCVIPHHCKQFYSPIFSNRFIFSVSALSRAAKPFSACNKIFVMSRHFITDQLLKASNKSLSNLIIYNFSDFIHVCGDRQGKIIPSWSNFDQHNHIISCKFQKICLTYDFI